MGLFSFLFGGGGGGGSQTTTVSSSTTVTVNPSITNVIDLSPLQKLIDGLTAGQADQSRLYTVAAVASLAGAKATADASAAEAAAISELGKKAVLLGGAALIAFIAFRRK